MAQRTTIPCANCQQNLIMPPERDEFLRCVHCGLEGPIVAMKLFAEMRGLLHGTAAALRDRRMRADTIELEIKGCERVSCEIKAGEAQEPPTCACAREELVRALRQRELQVAVLRADEAV